MTDYVTGFMFDLECNRVVLIRKIKPDWQAGYLNGVGGKVEPGETVVQAMEREFSEEAGLGVSAWLHVGSGHNFQTRLNVFAVQSNRIDQIRSMTDEIVNVYQVGLVPVLSVMPNLRWLIPMSINKLTRSGQTPDASLYFTCDT